jgi:hypothetical protein
MKHSYACRILRERGYKVYTAGEEILSQSYDKEHQKLITKINRDFDLNFGDNQDVERINEASEVLNRLNLKILKYKSNSSFAGQKIAYKLVKKNYPSNNIIDKMPNSHYVLYYPKAQKACMVGKNTTIQGMTEPISTIDTRESIAPVNMPTILNKESYLNFYENRIIKSLNKISTKNSFFIKEHVIGISDDNKIVCIEQPAKTDMPTIGIYGGKGQGKTILLNGLEDAFFSKWTIPCININDINPESQTRCLEWDSGFFRSELERFGEPSVPKPCIYLHPTTKSNYDKVHYGEVGFDVSISFKDIVTDENIINYNPGWKMNETGAGLVWKQLVYREGKLRIDGLAHLREHEEIESFIDREVKEKGMNRKIKTIINDIWNSRISDVSSGINSKWILKKKDLEYANTPWNIGIASGLFPYIITKGIRDEIWYPLWLRYILDDLIKFSKGTGFSLMVFSDEIAELLKNKVTEAIIEKLIRECRKAGMGFCMVAHSFDEVPEEISLHTNYHFVFNTNEDSVIQKMKRDYKLSNRQAQEIPNLEKFQCYAFGKFILYDTDGNCESNARKPVKIIRLKPSNCQNFGGGRK